MTSQTTSQCPTCGDEYLYHPTTGEARCYCTRHQDCSPTSKCQQRIAEYREAATTAA